MAVFTQKNSLLMSKLNLKLKIRKTFYEILRLEESSIRVGHLYVANDREELAGDAVPGENEEVQMDG